MEKYSSGSVIVTALQAPKTTNLPLLQKVKISWHSKETSDTSECETSVEIVIISLNTSLISLGRAHLHYKMESSYMIPLTESILVDDQVQVPNQGEDCNSLCLT